MQVDSEAREKAFTDKIERLQSYFEAISVRDVLATARKALDGRKRKNEEEKQTSLEWHRKMAAQLFNQTWDLIDKGENHTPSETDEMVHSAHASRYHWGYIVNSGKYPETGPKNLERGDWLISRVYALLKRQEPSLYHANRCFSICEENNIGDWDIAFALESFARAYALSGDPKSKEFMQKAKEAGEEISEEGDKKYLFDELETIK